MLDIKNGVRTNGNSAAMKGVMVIVSGSGNQGYRGVRFQAEALMPPLWEEKTALIYINAFFFQKSIY